MRSEFFPMQLDDSLYISIKALLNWLYSRLLGVECGPVVGSRSDCYT